MRAAGLVAAFVALLPPAPLFAQNKAQYDGFQIIVVKVIFGYKTDRDYHERPLPSASTLGPVSERVLAKIAQKQSVKDGR